MIQIIKNFLSEIKLLGTFSSMPASLVPIRVTEKFDVVERLPDYSRIYK
jgi:hypothetical protein